MNPEVLIAVVTALAQLAADEPLIVNGVQTVVGLIRSGNAPTAEQQAQIDALLDAAHVRLQGAAAPATPSASS